MPPVRDLVAAYQAGDPQALEKLLEAYRPIMKRLVSKSRTMDEDGALANLATVLEQAALKVPSTVLNDPQESPGGYLSVSLHHAHHRFLAREYRYREVVSIQAPETLPEAPADVLSPEAEYVQAERLAFTTAAVEGLPDEEHKVIQALYYDGLTVQQAADILGLSNITVRRREETALQRLKKRLVELA